MNPEINIVLISEIICELTDSVRCEKQQREATEGTVSVTPVYVKHTLYNIIKHLTQPVKDPPQLIVFARLISNSFCEN